ncbi:MAG TPA: fumarylacetoacetate hydrolase family protein [Candidatus Paceibacterota bacterium]|nr:fumarylacetoacetate hydrolase family protein [Candidatus Paceibacterota bacterium]
MSKSLAVVCTLENPYQLVAAEGGRYFAIPGLNTLTDALHLRLSELRGFVNGTLGVEVNGILQAPMATETEIWGAGVTYLRSRDARKEESGVPDVYQRVYEADRPELFYKGNARRTVGDGADIGIRADSGSSVPEPEVAIVINRFQEVIGLTICNDMTARTIEGENPLYLSQAKIYVGSTSLGPTIKPFWDISEPKGIGISANIQRGADVVWLAQTSLAALHRSFDDLVSYLFRCQVFPDGVILSTGTGIVPPLDVSLEVGDIVSISVDEVGTLTNEVALIPLDIHKVTLDI